MKKCYKGDSHFYPNLYFDNGSSKTSMSKIDLDKLKVKVFNRCQWISSELKSVFGSETAIEAIRTNAGNVSLNITCPVRHCNFKGKNLARHLTIGKHSYTSAAGLLYQSFARRMFNYITKINKTKQPVVCILCKVVQGNIESHLIKCHHILSGSSQIKFFINDCKQYLITNPILWRQTPIPTELSAISITQQSSEKYIEHDCTMSELPSVENTSNNKIHLTKEFMEIYNIRMEDFKFYFNNAENALNSFETNCIVTRDISPDQSRMYKNNITNIWRAVDNTLSIFPNSLSDLNLIKDKWLDPNIMRLKSQLKNPLIERGDTFYQASTLRSKLLCVSYFFDFSLSEYCYIGINAQDLVICKLKITHMMKRLNKLERQRKIAIRNFKCKNLITETDLVEYFKSNNIRKTIKFLDNLFEGSEQIPTLRDCRNSRNYIMVTLTVINALRSSNLLNITLHDIKNAATHEIYKNAKFIESEYYKTSLIYGTKLILISLHLYDQINTFIKHMRPMLTNDQHLPLDRRYLFTCYNENIISASSTAKITQSMISSMITSSFQLSEVSFHFFFFFFFYGKVFKVINLKI